MAQYFIAEQIKELIPFKEIAVYEIAEDIYSFRIVRKKIWKNIVSILFKFAEFITVKNGNTTWLLQKGIDNWYYSAYHREGSNSKSYYSAKDIKISMEASFQILYEKMKIEIGVISFFKDGISLCSVLFDNQENEQVIFCWGEEI